MYVFPFLAVSRMAAMSRTRCGARPVGVRLWPASKPESCGTQSATSPVRPLTRLLRAAFPSEKTTGGGGALPIPAPHARPSWQIVWTTATASASPAIGCVSSIVIICNGWTLHTANAYDSREATTVRLIDRVCHHCSSRPASQQNLVRREGIARIFSPGEKKRPTSGATPVMFTCPGSPARASKETRPVLAAFKARREAHRAKCDSQRNPAKALRAQLRVS
ncbi:hypothetical protein LX36DRAFT_110406 [Colletotrichum falcatum]|nr:hypothetical protein LX36DRAFT_110406 [Colletotrichum falcatum]